MRQFRIGGLYKLSVSMFGVQSVLRTNTVDIDRPVLGFSYQTGNGSMSVYNPVYRILLGRNRVLRIRNLMLLESAGKLRFIFIFGLLDF